MSVKLSCPSCNTAFTLPTLPGNRRAQCPRCGDVFPVHSYTEQPDGGTPASATGSGGTTSLPRTHGEGRRMIGVFAAAIVGVLLAGLPPFIVYWRAKNKPAPPPAPAPLVAATAKPYSQLTAIGHLRGDCNIAFAVQSAPLLAYAERTKQDPRAVLSQTGLPDIARNVIEQLGVDLAQIDHVAGGLSLGDGQENLRLALVLVLKQPLADEDEFLKKLKAKPVAGKKTRHDVVAGRFPFLLARVSPTVWVFDLDDKDFDAVEKGHGLGGSQFRGNFRTMLNAVPPDAAVWLAADDDRDWTQKPAMKLIGQSAEGKKWLPAVKDGRGGLIAVSFGEQPRLKVHVRAVDEKIGDRVRAYFADRAKETEGATSGGGGTLAHFDAPFNPATAGQLLQKFLTDAGR